MTLSVTQAPMGTPTTEAALDAYRDLDRWPAADILAAIAEAQAAAVRGVSAALPALEAASRVFADTIRSGGRVIYAGAGSSGLIAQLDALELPGTFGIAEAQVVVLLAGGRGLWDRLQGDVEDDAVAARADLAGLAPTSDDCLVAVSASGSTPYTVAVAEAARVAGSRVIALACNAGAPLLLAADVAVHLPTPPEVLAGSTRMNAGSAQKAALNMLSTLAAVRLGHVHDGLMVNVRPDNAKLRARAAGIVARAAGCDGATAARLLAGAGDDVKLAVVTHRLGSLETARAALARAGGHVRAALGGG